MSETPRPGQERWVAPLEETPLRAVDSVDDDAPPESQWKEAWKRMRVNPLFWVSSVLLFLLAIMLAVPGLFTSQDPTFCQLSDSLGPARSGHPFGFNQQGCDVWARTLYGARASVLVGVVTTLIVALIGVVTGAVAGFYGRWLDAVISRIADIFFSIPLLLAAIVTLSVLNNVFPDRGFWGGCMAVILALSLFAWPSITRQMRAAVLTVKNLEFVDAAKAIGASPRANLVRHIVPNSLAPVIVTSTISLGIFIVTEATLSFLGLGLPNQVISWGNDISDAQVLVRAGDNLSVMFVPATALALTVLAFILLGDAVKDALDPKARKS
ncbi:ABC transporter, permease protein [Aeromicrobium marinum DSM 15272]|uniref:ABC transporter, permease protein n=1 Tax=Aeromicrobium marinum DSM 15272 TaxID=585531 RepID=E2SCV5_9ACTN|nr:ABC transporter permease [Aeromicrobium marinum]EFQ83058.1 ABC transporter, permease protein [Aeromicrobium marinum DSM 15272]